jgi:hypothetical protein
MRTLRGQPADASGSSRSERSRPVVAGLSRFLERLRWRSFAWCRRCCRSYAGSGRRSAPLSGCRQGFAAMANSRSFRGRSIELGRRLWCRPALVIVTEVAPRRFSYRRAAAEGVQWEPRRSPCMSRTSTSPRSPRVRCISCRSGTRTAQPSSWTSLRRTTVPCSCKHGQDAEEAWPQAWVHYQGHQGGQHPTHAPSAPDHQAAGHRLRATSSMARIGCDRLSSTPPG